MVCAWCLTIVSCIQRLHQQGASKRVLQQQRCCMYVQVVQPDVVLVTYDALISDMSQLQPIEWEAIAVDERNRVQPSLAKAHQALRELDANFRLLLPSGNPTKVCCACA